MKRTQDNQADPTWQLYSSDGRLIAENGHVYDQGALNAVVAKMMALPEPKSHDMRPAPLVGAPSKR